MKNLKIKFGLFSLLAILAVSVFLTSCEQEIIRTVPTIEETLTNDDNNFLLLPYGYEQLSMEEQHNYLNSLNKVTYDELIESAKILDYFKSLGKENILLDNSEYGEIYAVTTLAVYLTAEEVENFQLSTDDNLESRGCDCDPNYQYRSSHCGWFGSFPGASYLYYEKWVKECHAWYCWDKVSWRNHRRPLPGDC